MVDFSSIAKQAAGQSKKPPMLPAGDYPSVIKSFEWGDNNAKKTPYVRLNFGFSGFPDGLPEEWEEFDNEKQTSFKVTRADIDLTKRQMRKDFYMTDDSKYRMDEFLKTMGVNCGTEDASRSYEETLPELVGAQVLSEVQHKLNQQTNVTYPQIGKVIPLA